jgi:DNA-binding XRE family transcriptional regulator
MRSGKLLMPAFSGIRSHMANPRRRKPSSDDAVPEISNLGRSFAARRIELRLTQQTVADLAGVSRYSVQALERGSGGIKLASVVDIADVLGLRLKATNEAE